MSVGRGLNLSSNILSWCTNRAGGPVPSLSKKMESGRILSLKGTHEAFNPLEEALGHWCAFKCLKIRDELKMEAPQSLYSAD